MALELGVRLRQRDPDLVAAKQELAHATADVPKLREKLESRHPPVADAEAAEAALAAERAEHMSAIGAAHEEATEGLKGIHWADFFELKRRNFFVPELLKRIFDCVIILRQMELNPVTYEVETDVQLASCVRPGRSLALPVALPRLLPVSFLPPPWLA